MKRTLTITSKGQTTIPAPIRRKLGLSKTGGTLDMDYNETTNELVISKAMSSEELSQRLTNYIKPGTKPLIDADAYYQANRDK